MPFMLTFPVALKKFELTLFLVEFSRYEPPRFFLLRKMWQHDFEGEIMMLKRFLALTLTIAMLMLGSAFAAAQDKDAKPEATTQENALDEYIKNARGM